MPTELLHPDPRSHPPEARHRDGSGGSEEDEADPELVALPPPPRAERRWTLVLLLLVSVTASAMAFALRGESAYALGGRADVDVGDLYSLDTAQVAYNEYIRGHGALGGALAVRFERPFEGDTYRVSPVMGRRDLWVEVRVPSGSEGGRYVPPTGFSGRFVRWRDSGLRHRGLLHAVGALTGEEVPTDAKLLVDGESPSTARWTLGLALLFAGFALWSALTAARLVRRVA